ETMATDAASLSAAVERARCSRFPIVLLSICTRAVQFSSGTLPSRNEKEEGKGKKEKGKKDSMRADPGSIRKDEVCKMALRKRALLRKGSVENGAADYRIEKLTCSARRAKKKRIPKLKKSSERWSTMTKASTSVFLGRR